MGRHLVEEEAVVAHEEQGAGEAPQGVFEVLEGGDVQVVGGLVQHQQVGGTEHGFGEQQAVPLAAAQARCVAPLVRHGKAEAGEVDMGRRDGAAEIHRRRAFTKVPGKVAAAIQLAAALAEGGDLELGMTAQLPTGGVQLAEQQLQQRRLSASIGAEQCDAHAALEDEVQAAKKFGSAIAESQGPAVEKRVTSVASTLEGESLFGHELRAVGHFVLEIQHFLDAEFGFSGAGLRAAPQPRQLRAKAVLHVVREARFPELLVGLQEQVVAVAAVVARGLAVLQLHHAIHDGIEKLAIVGDEEERARKGLEPGLELLHLIGVEVVRGLVQYEHFRLTQPRLGEGHALAPTAG